jgi:hypothetical protein
MPTYQTAPLYPNVFPTLSHNPFGVRPLKGNTLAHADLPAPGDSYHPTWKRDADFRVEARLENNAIKDRAMLQPQPSIKGSLYTTSRGPQGHAFEGRLSGGTVWTTRAEETIQRLLRDRKTQLDAINAASFDAPSTPAQKEAVTELDTFPLDQLFSTLASSLDQGIVNGTLLSTMSSIMNFFMTKADRIPDQKFAEYAGKLNEIKETLDALFDEDEETFDSPGEYKKAGKILRKLENDILVLSKFISEYMNYLGNPTKAKTAKMQALRNKIMAAHGIADTSGVEEVEGEAPALAPGLANLGQFARNPPTFEGNPSQEEGQPLPGYYEQLANPRIGLGRKYRK